MKRSLDQKRLVGQFVNQVKRLKKSQKGKENAFFKKVGVMHYQSILKKSESKKRPKIQIYKKRKIKEKEAIERKNSLGNVLWKVKQQMTALNIYEPDQTTSSIRHSATCPINEVIQSIKRDQMLLEFQVARIELKRREIETYQSMLDDLDEDIGQEWSSLALFDDELCSEKRWAHLLMDEIISQLKTVAAHPSMINEKLVEAHTLKMNTFDHIDTVKEKTKNIQQRKVAFYLKAIIWSLLCVLMSTRLLLWLH